MRKFIVPMLLFSAVAWAQNKQTLTYFQNDTLSLEMDLFTPKKKFKQPLPLVLFVHGGGFSGGSREQGYDFCKYLAQNGYAAATISYSLYMKNKKFSCDGQLVEKIRAFQYGASDLWLATNYAVANATALQIDASKIFIAGSSAGGETVLHAAYWKREKMQLYPTPALSQNFRYAGLISGSGAIMDLGLIDKDNILPMLLFHGSGDPVVPYGTAPHHYCAPGSSGWLMLFGSYELYEHANAHNSPVSLHTYCHGGHEYSAVLFTKDAPPVLDFLQKTLLGQHFSNHNIIATGKKSHTPQQYDFCP